MAEKYLFGLLTGIGGWLAAAVLAITMAGQPAADDDLWWMLYIGALLLMLVMQALMIPVQLKLGGQKGRVAILVLLAVIFGAAVAAVKNEKLGTSIWNGLTSLEPAEICLAGAAAALICLFISFLCSVRIMERKEF